MGPFWKATTDKVADILDKSISKKFHLALEIRFNDVSIRLGRLSVAERTN